MKYFYKVLLLLISVVTLSSFTEKNCTILKNNTFTYKVQNEDVLVTFKENTHIEYHNNKKYFIKSDIEWINDCEYNLIIKETTLPDFPFKMGTKLHVLILKVKGDKVYHRTSISGRTWEGRLIKTKN